MFLGAGGKDKRMSKDKQSKAFLEILPTLLKKDLIAIVKQNAKLYARLKIGGLQNKSKATLDDAISGQFFGPASDPQNAAEIVNSYYSVTEEEAEGEEEEEKAKKEEEEEEEEEVKAEAEQEAVTYPHRRSRIGPQYQAVVPDAVPPHRPRRSPTAGAAGEEKKENKELSEPRLQRLKLNVLQHILQYDGDDSVRRVLIAIRSHLEQLPAGVIVLYNGETKQAHILGSSHNRRFVTLQCEPETSAAAKRTTCKRLIFGADASRLASTFIKDVVKHGVWPERFHARQDYAVHLKQAELVLLTDRVLSKII
jgi:hypothetical protein